MKNREKYKEELLDIAISGNVMALVKGEPKCCADIRCRGCDITKICGTDLEAAGRQKWAEKEAE